MKTIGYITIIIGLILTIFTAFTYFTKEKVIDLGKIEITRNEPHHIDWSPMLGIALMGVGGLGVWLSSKKQ